MLYALKAIYGFCLAGKGGIKGQEIQSCKHIFDNIEGRQSHLGMMNLLDTLGMIWKDNCNIMLAWVYIWKKIEIT